MHYTGMAAVHAQAAPGLVVSTANTASASGFLLPLIIGLGSLGFIFSTVIALSPTAAEIVEENALMQRIGQSQLAQSQAARHEAQGQAGQGRLGRAAGLAGPGVRERERLPERPGLLERPAERARAVEWARAAG